MRDKERARPPGPLIDTRCSVCGGLGGYGLEEGGRITWFGGGHLPARWHEIGDRVGRPRTAPGPCYSSTPPFAPMPAAPVTEEPPDFV